jgi:hypothetical protein
MRMAERTDILRVKGEVRANAARDDMRSVHGGRGAAWMGAQREGGEHAGAHLPPRGALIELVATPSEPIRLAPSVQGPQLVLVTPGLSCRR